MKIRGKGSVQPLEKAPKARCRKWRLFVSTDAGQRTRVLHGTWTQAQDALEAFKRELADEVPCSDTFGAYAESWRLWREKSGNFAPGTLANDAREVRAILRSPIAEKRLDSITPDDCREALLWLKTHRQRGEGELSGTTMNSLHVCMGAVFQQAVDDGRMAASPMAHIAPPKVDTREKDALSPAEVAGLLDALDALPLDGRVMAVWLITCLGLRRAEACAIADADITGGFAHVHAAVKERDGSIAEPKSAAGVRTLPVPDVLASKVDEWRGVRRERGWGDAPTLCCNTRGGVLRPQLLQRWWSGDAAHVGVRDSLGCAGMTLHQLRHSNLSMMARHMSPFDLQRWAGWSSIEPARVYIHADMDALSRAVSGAFPCS